MRLSFFWAVCWRMFFIAGGQRNATMNTFDNSDVFVQHNDVRQSVCAALIASCWLLTGECKILKG